MSQTVIGLFDTPASAERVKQQLITEGHSPESIRVLSNESEGFAEGAMAQARATSSAGTGMVASVKNFFQSLASPGSNEEEFYTRGVSAGGALVAVTVADERVESVASLLEVSGAREVSENTAGGVGGTGDTYRETPVTETGNTYGGTATANTGETTIPVLEENLQVGKRQVQRRGVRIYSHVTERPVEEQVRLREEHVRVQRNPVNRPASEADFNALQGGSIELTETAEEAVVAKQARVVEEVVVGKDATERTETVTDKVRRTEVEVEQIPGETISKGKSAGKR
jgi:uncharacterized protein (TIGR02271 family)